MSLQMGPMSLGAMSFGSESAAFIPDFAMALHRPDRPVFQQASPTSPYQTGLLPVYNRQQRQQYAYSQPGARERSRSMSLDQGAPAEYAPRSYQYPTSMPYQPQSVPMHLAASYAMGKVDGCIVLCVIGRTMSLIRTWVPVPVQAAHAHQPQAPSIALGPSAYPYMSAAPAQVPMELGLPQHGYPSAVQQQPQEDDGSHAFWDPFFSDAAQEFDTETKIDTSDDAERGSSADAKNKGKMHRRRRSNSNQQNRRTPQKQRGPKEQQPAVHPSHPLHGHGHPPPHSRHGHGPDSNRTRAQSWSDAGV